MEAARRRRRRPVAGREHDDNDGPTRDNDSHLDVRKSSAHAERRASAARHRSAWASASSRPPRFEDALRTAAGRRGLVRAKWRTTSADERGGSRRRAREVRGGRIARPTVAPKRARPRGSERALAGCTGRRGSVGRFGQRRRAGFSGVEGDRGWVWQRARPRPIGRVR